MGRAERSPGLKVSRWLAAAWFYRFIAFGVLLSELDAKDGFVKRDYPVLSVGVPFFVH